MGEEDFELQNITCPSCGGAGSLKLQETEDLHYAGPPKQTKIDKISHHPEYDISFEFLYLCPKCGGKGQVDWISNIVGCKGYFIITSTQQHKEAHKQWTKR